MLTSLLVRVIDYVTVSWKANRCVSGQRHWNFEAAGNLGEIVYIAVTTPLIDGLVTFDLDVAIELHAGAGGNQPAHDDVLLQATQIIHAHPNSRFGQDAVG